MTGYSLEFLLILEAERQTKHYFQRVFRMKYKALTIGIKLARAISDRFYRRVYLIDCHFAIGGARTSESDAIVLHEIDLLLF